MALSDLSTRSIFDKVCVQGKIIHVDKEMTVAGGKSKQDVIITDSSCAGKVTLREQDIGLLEEGTSYDVCDTKCIWNDCLQHCSTEKVTVESILCVYDNTITVISKL